MLLKTGSPSLLTQLMTHVYQNPINFVRLPVQLARIGVPGAAVFVHMSTDNCLRMFLFLYIYISAYKKIKARQFESDSGF